MAKTIKYEAVESTIIRKLPCGDWVSVRVTRHRLIADGRFARGVPMKRFVARNSAPFRKLLRDIADVAEWHAKKEEGPKKEET